MSWIFVCPGQGSQQVGMGHSLMQNSASAAQVFQEIDEALGEKLSQIIFEGDQDTLTLTRNAQPALMAVSVAAFRFLQNEFGENLLHRAKYVAGHSLGEYSALTIAGALSVADCARLLRLRGNAMQSAVGVGVGAMAAVLGLDFAAVESIAKEAAQGQVCSAANDNAPGQIVISGHREAVERAIELAKAKGAKRAILLPVSAPFHCALMESAAQAMAEALAQTQINVPQVPVVSNVLAQSVTDVSQIRDLLVRQVTGVVRWSESMAWVGAQGDVSQLLEIGAGKVLCGLNKRILPEMSTYNFGQVSDLEALKAVLS